MNTLKVEFNLKSWLIRTLFACSFICFPIGLYFSELNYPNLIYSKSLIYTFCVLNLIFFGLTFTKILKNGTYEYLLVFINLSSIFILLWLYNLNNCHHLFLLGFIVPFTFINLIYHSYRTHLILVSTISISVTLIGFFKADPIIHPLLALTLIGSIALANNLTFLYKILNNLKAATANEALNSTNSFLLIFNSSGKIEQINNSLSNLLPNKSPVNLTDVFNKEDIHLFFSNKKKQEITTKHNTPYKGVRRIKWKKSNIQNSFVIVGHDVTNEEKKKEELENLSLVAYKSMNGVAILDENYNVSWVNQALENITGYSLSDLKGRKPSDVIKVAKNYRDKAVSTRQMTAGLTKDLPHYKKNGDLVWLSIDSTPIYDSSGKLLKQVETIRDITIQKQQEFELQKQSLIAKFTDHSVIITDNNLSIEWVNTAFTRDTGFSFEEIKGQKVYGGLLDPDEINQFVSKIGLPSFELVNKYIRKDGVISWAKLHFNLVEDGYKYIIVATEITKDVENIEKLELYSKHNKISSSLSKTLLRDSSFDDKVFDALEIMCELKEEYVSSSFIKYCPNLEKATYFGYSKIEEKSFSGELDQLFNQNALSSLKQNLYYIVADLEESAESTFKDKFEELGIRSYIMYPIFHKGKLYGSINIRSSIANNFNGNDIIPIQEFANSFTFFVKNNIAQKKIKESEINFRQLNESLSEVFWLYDIIEDKSLYVSKSIESLFGYKVDNFLDDNMFWTSRVHNEDKEKVDESFEVSKQTGVFEETYRIVTIDDEVKWIEEKIFPIKDEKGKIIKLSGIAKDVTFKVKAEQKLKSLASRLDTTNRLNNAVLQNKPIDDIIIDMFKNYLGLDYIINISILTFDYKNELANYYFNYGMLAPNNEPISLDHIKSLNHLIKNDYKIVKNFKDEEFLSESDKKSIEVGSNGYIVTGIKQNDILIGSLNVSLSNSDLINDELKEICLDITSSISLSLLQKKLESELTIEKENLYKSNKDITDSIVYATRIQNAHFPDFKILEENNISSNLIFLPKDIVSGDFYWWTQIDNKIVIALADCTGHGVPGAFMTILGANYLKLIVEENEIIDPGMILTQLNISVYNTLFTKNSSFVDGMDITLITYDRIDKTIEYASAKRPLIHLTKGKTNRIPGEIYSIGEVLDMIFTTKSLEIENGDKLFLYSDGIVDQFGGPKNKKFSSKRLFNLIEENSDKSTAEIHQIIDLELANWKGNNTQIDDIALLSLEF